MTDKTHVHRLKRHVHKSGHAIFFCTLPDCTYKINVALALGKRAICWRCGKEFLLDEYALRLVKPHCEDCHKHKKDEVIAIPETPAPVKVEETEDLAERLEKQFHEVQEDLEHDI